MNAILKFFSKIILSQEIFCKGILIIILTFIALFVSLTCYLLMPLTKASFEFLDNLVGYYTKLTNDLKEIHKMINKEKKQDE